MKAALLGISIVQASIEIAIIIGIGSGLLGVRWEIPRKKLLFIFLLIGFFCAMTKQIQIFPALHTLSVVLLTIAVVKLTFHLPIPRAIMTVLLGVTILALVENISILIFTRLTGLSFAEIAKNPLLRIKYALPHMAFLVGLTFFMQRRMNWGCDFFSSEFEVTGERGGKRTVLTNTLQIFILVQVILLTAVNIIMSLNITGIIQHSILHTQLLWVNSFLTISLVLALLVYRKLFQIAEQELLLDAQKALFQNVNELFNTIRTQRHDFVNQLQSIYGYLMLGKIDECRAYVGGLVQETAVFSELLSVNHPGLCALLLSKTAVAESKKILLNIECDINLENLKLKSHHLNDMIGNLIDNAFEAVFTEAPEERLVLVKISSEKGFLSFQVVNKGPLIPTELISKIFDPGFTTKKPDEHMGIGLYSVKTLVDKYKGQIGVKSEEPAGTVFTIVLPHNN